MKKISSKKGSVLALVLAFVFALAACTKPVTSYTVSFDTDGGGTVTAQTVDEGKKAAKPDPDPVKTGYRLDNWYKDSAKTVAFVFETETISANITVYAKWLANTYTVAYDKNAADASGATASGSHTYDAAKNLTVNGFTRDGYIFDGWNTAAGGTGTSYTDGQSVTNLTAVHQATVTLYAKWKAGYEVTFNVDGGTEIAGQVVVSGEKALRPATDPAKTGYRFDNWYKADGTTLFNFASEAITGVTTVYAKWNANTYTVAYDKNAAGATGATASSSHTYDGAEALAANGFTRDGYGFKGWNTLADGSGTAYAAEQPVTNLTATHGATITLYAQWALYDGIDGKYAGYGQWVGGSIPYWSFEVQLNGYGSGLVSVKMSDDQIVWTEFFNGDPYPDPCPITYTLSGDKVLIYIDGIAFDQFDITVMPSGSLYIVVFEVSAELRKEGSIFTYTVDFDSDGGGDVAPQQVTEGEFATAPSDPVKTGYTFDGWYADGEPETCDFENTAITGNITLYALWTANTYTVAYNKNAADASGATASGSHTYDAAKALNANGFTRTGYTFTGWNTLANGTGTAYAAGEQVSNLTAAAGGIVTLYAQWTANTYTVTYDKNAADASGATASGSHTYDAAKALNANGFTRTGYTFTGWNTLANGTGTAYAAGESVSNLTAEPGGSVTLYAQWTANTYSVKYDANTGAGTAMDDSAHTYDIAKTLRPNTYTKANYTFSGWNTLANGEGTAYTAEQSVINLTSVDGGTVTLYAQWIEDGQYQVTFNTDGGSQITAQNVYDGEKAVRPAADPTKAGYVFVNWYKADMTTLFDFNSEIINDATTVYAKWVPITYTVKYDAGTGSGAMEDSAHTYDAAKALNANAFTKTGYTFAGWATASGGEAVYGDGAQVANLNDIQGAEITLYALWTANTYTVAYNRNGATGTTTSTTHTYDVSKALASTSVTRTGFVFVGLCLDSAGNGTIYALGANAINLTAENGATVTMYYIWARLITLNANGAGSNATDNAIMAGSATSGDYVLSGCTFTRAGYYFSGWGTAAAGGTIRQPGTAVNVTAATTFYAQWTMNVIFDSDGGTAVTGQAVVIGEKAALPAAPTKTGYTFAGWYLDGSVTPFDFENTTLETHIVLKAMWTANIYKVEFNANGGSGAMADQEFTYDAAAAALSGNTLIRTGFAFTGWNTSADGLGTSYENGAEVRNLTSAENGTFVLYAQWIIENYTVIYDKNDNGAIGGMSDDSRTYGDGLALTANAFTKEGYLFNGWNMSADGTGFAYADGYTGDINAVSIQVTLYAQWKPISYTITYERNGSTTTVANTTHYYDTPGTISAANPTKTGYTFKGWSFNADGSGVLYASGAAIPNNLTTVNGDVITMYAVWEGNIITITFNVASGTGTMATVSYKVGTAMNLPVCTLTRSGYYFAGWGTSSSGTTVNYVDGGLVTTLTANQTLYAKWSNSTAAYTVTYDANAEDAIGTMEDSSHVYRTASNLSANAFTRNGYVFMGWAAANNGAAVYADGQSVTGVSSMTVANTACTLYAVWGGNINFNTDGGSSIARQSVKTDGKVTAPADPEKTGYAFSGWYTSGEFTTAFDFETFTVTQTGIEIVIYAKWTAYAYTIQYDANSGTGAAMSNSSHIYGTPTALNENTYTKAGYAFTGWNTEADGTGTSYADGAAVNIIAENNAVITLYAQWFNSAAFGTYTTTRVTSTTDGSRPANMPELENKTWPVLNKNELPENVLWNGETFSGVYTLQHTYIIVAMAIRIEVYGDGTGMLMIGSGATNGGWFTYTISGDILTMDYLNATGADAPTTGSFTISSANRIYVGSVAGYSINKYAVKADDIRGLTIDADGTGKLTTTNNSEVTTVTDITWTIVNATTLNIMSGSTVLCTVKIIDSSTIEFGYYRSATQSSSTTWTTINSTAVKQ